METSPTPQEVQTTSPLVKYNTSEKDYEFQWFNTLLRMYSDTYLDSVRYTEDEDESYLLVPEGLRDELVKQNFPFSYFPTPDHERFWYKPQSNPPKKFKDRYEPMNISHGETNYELQWDNTVMRVFGEHELNHLEVRTGNSIKGVFAEEGVWQHLFANNYPLIYLPTVEMDQSTKQWFEGHKTGGTQK